MRSERNVNGLTKSQDTAQAAAAPFPVSPTPSVSEGSGFTKGALPRPDLPAHHPQNVPLEQWSDGWLKMSVAGHHHVSYVMMHDHERAERGLPVTRDEMIEFLVSKGDVPAAGRTALSRAGASS